MKGLKDHLTVKPLTIGRVLSSSSLRQNLIPVQLPLKIFPEVYCGYMQKFSTKVAVGDELGHMKQ
jgi:hypothetical protein